ncbi:SpvB/TcaC N-terminal domain-containing protein [Mucilaginibacter psychrotolerans]|uniref:Insecticide toxin TcdB middle/N-terminal domain-containing protein n=1 Tax=Mucilaginibacter psychrotolerans TaxID=1524096 RepID=A0A4Y8SHJ3_9SPHI|nr:SpvB/TcaC N-terminal domain-containing protein [Mucilaginibacter psychrotolerans]TFF38509.1 hypothetical protein E2R66_08560 [Mucilaginibacter psychrotolerans]
MNKNTCFAFIGLFVLSIGFGETLKLLPKKSAVVPKTKATTPAPVVTKRTVENFFNADISGGVIGTTNELRADAAYDNIFHIRLPQLPKSGEIVTLRYRLKGVKNNASIARSVNDAQATGGYLTELSGDWTAQKEYLATVTLRKGDNVVRFGLPSDAGFNYEVKNVSLVIEQVEKKKAIFLNSDGGRYYGSHAYLSGVLNTPARLFFNNVPVTVRQGEFEIVTTAPEKSVKPFSGVLKAILPSGEAIVKTINFTATKTSAVYHTPGEKGISNTGLYHVAAGLSLTLKNAGVQASVNIPSGALAANTNVSITALRYQDTPPVGTDMVNVTSGAVAYRFLPHGSRFAKPVYLRLPVDKTLLPEGYTTADVQTFYFDETARKWVALKIDTAAAQGETAGAVTTHFTDMINAIIKVPESPQTQGYTPTSIKDYKAANPSAGIDMIAPPDANDMGTASLSYPIKLPKGRLGMQPNLNLQYSNEGGNGWLGLGWSLPVAVIDIDTRWGVPRYDATLETETYTMGGEQLAPLANRTAYVARVTERQFHSRIEGSFQKITRHGNNPMNYWWEVTNKNGVRSFYGGTPSTGLIDAAVLKDDAGNVAHWALVETRDLHDNFVAYQYQTILNTGVVGGTVPGKQLYPKDITYTGSGSTPGFYKVAFTVGSPNYKRRDIEINARLGFKMVTADVLNSIDVTYKGQLIRNYVFLYQEGQFHKTLLKDIKANDDDKRLFYTHNFEYFDDTKVNGANAFLGNVEDWSPTNDHIQGGLLNPLPKYTDQSSALSTVKSSSIGGGLALTIGIGYSQDKSFSVGGGVGYQGGGNEGLVTMADINGDGLPDKILKKDGALYYRPNLGVLAHSFGDLHPITGIGNFSSGNSRTIKWNVQAVPPFGFVGYERSTTTSTTSEYFTDFNGDGLIDIASNGQVYFNHLDKNGNPFFEPSSAATPSPIVPFGSIDKQFLAPDLALQATQEADYPLQDAVRYWKAPFKGNITITGPVQLLPVNNSGLVNAKEDGVRASIQLNGGNPNWSTVIAAGDYSIKTPSNVSNISVNAGDRLYFRVQSVYNGDGDKVKWDPVITYQNTLAPAIDANHRASNKYQASKDFILHNKKGVYMASAGNIKIDGDFIKGVTSDTATLIIRIIKSSGASNVLYTHSFNNLATTAAPSVANVPVAAGDTVKFYIQTDSYVDRAAFKWNAHYVYTSFDDNSPVINANGKPVVEGYVVPDNTNYNEWYKKAPVFSRVTADTIALVPDVIGSGAANGKVVFTIKGNDTVYAKKILSLSGGAVTNMPDTIKLILKPGQEYFFDYAATDHALAEALTRSRVVIHTGTAKATVEANIYTNPKDDLFGPLFRGWGQFSVKGVKEGTAPIDESKLNNDQYKNYPNDPNNYPDPQSLQGFANPTSSDFITMFADAQRQAWMGLDTAVFVSDAMAGSARLFLHDVSVDPLMTGSALQAAAKINSSTTKSFTYGFGLNKSESTSDNTTKLDMMDMNGDRYPDVLNEDNVQYTQPNGGLEPFIKSSHFLGGSSGEGKMTGITLGGDFLKAAGTNKTASTAVDVIQNAQASFGIFDFGNSNTQEGNTTWADVNGDGLPDKVYKSGLVALNLGYRFAQPENWGITAISKSSTKADQAGHSFNFFGGSWEGGFGLSRSEDTGSFILSDVNGDGLTDQVYQDGVQLNIGNGFDQKISWSDLSNFSNNVSTGESLNTAYTIAFNPFFFLPIKICINPSFNIGHSVSRELDQITDIDGDGYPDILHSENDGDLKVRRSLIGRTNMLSVVRRPMGSFFAIDYARLGNTYQIPQNKWVLKNLKIFDGVSGDGVDTMRNTFTYLGGHYNRHEREFYGFDTVITNHLNTADNDKVYRSSVQRFINSSYYTKGLMMAEWLQDGDGHRFTETDNLYDMRQVAGVEDVFFPALVQSTKLFYEGQATAGVSTATKFDYDAIGNMTDIFDQGDGTPDDIIQAKVTYHDNNALYIKGIPQSIEVTTTEGLKRRRSTSISNLGDITQINQYLADGSASVYDMTYDPYGNLAQITRPANATKQRMFYRYVYDDAVHSYVTKVTDAYGYSSTSNYEYRFGNDTLNVSMNNELTRFTIDNKGRITSITGPHEIASGDTTISFEYYPTEINKVPYAITHHFDPQYGRGNDISTVTFMDGLGRPLQVKKQVAIFGGKNKADIAKLVVSGRVKFDAFGRSIENYYPVTEDAVFGRLSPLNTSFNTTYGNINSKTTYDVLDRTLTETLADGALSKMAYTIDNSFFVTTATDALNNIRQTINDVRERKRADKALSGPAGTITTKFDYNALSELVKVEDNNGNTTKYTYDNLGRKLTAEYPDAGLVNFAYDLAGNLTQKITAQIRKEIPNGGAINYQYEYERLIGIDYQRQYQNKVTYKYGAPATGKSQLQDDRAGRLILQEDASGGLEFYYGRLGEITKQIRTVMVSPIFYTTYVSQQEYDTWNRLTYMTYPDGEKLTYHYNHGGTLDKITGNKEGQPYSYVNQLGYDEYEQRVYLQYGNLTETTYAYDNLRRRLTTLNATTATGRYMMKNSYRYDFLSNIRSITNSADAQKDKLGGGSAQTYGYDNLYRLVSAKGKYMGPKDTVEYSLNMAYDNLYNITSKTLKNPKPADSYKQDYTYAATIHQPTKIGTKEYTYDLNGNQLTFGKRENFWDEENRLMAVIDSGTQSRYTYDAGGERIVKSSGGLQGNWVNGAPAGTVNHYDNYTVYVSPYLVCRRLTFTKHIYIESQRIATKIGNGQFLNISFPESALTAGSINYINRAKQLQRDRILYYGQEKVSPGPPTSKLFFAEPQNNGIAAPVLIDSTNAVPKGWPGNTTPPLGGPPVYTQPIPGNDSVLAGYGFVDTAKVKVENNRYFYHSDHLGSTAYITDALGEVTQHQEYSAFGETYVDEHTGNYLSPYLFNAKEKDTETGLYYYGARYYNPQQSQWISVDPMVDKYPALSPYNYVLNNPVKLVDPGGKDVKEYLGIAASTALNFSPLGEVKGIAEAYTGRDLITGQKLAWWERGLGVIPVVGGLTKAAKAAKAVNNVAHVAEEANGIAKAAEGIQKLEKAEEAIITTAKIGDDATVVRGGLNKAKDIERGTGKHPSGIVGVSVECGNCSVKELSKDLPHGSVGVTTAGKIREAGGDVVRTSGRSPNHATVTGLSNEKASELLNPVIKNPNKQ